MRAKTVLTAIALLSVGYMVLTAPDVLGFVLMVIGAVWFWQATKRAGVRR